jgi:quercetin dioxygenase-like cupin family protein
MYNDESPPGRRPWTTESAKTSAGGIAMQLLAWESVKKEVLNDKLWRKLVTGEKAMVAQLFLAQGCLVPTHQHVSEQISLILEGALKFELEGREIMVRAGEVLVIPSSVPHSALALEDTRGFDVFSPIRQDWLDGTDSYLRK